MQDQPTPDAASSQSDQAIHFLGSDDFSNILSATKPWWLSKTLWAGVLIFLLSALSAPDFGQLLQSWGLSQPLVSWITTHLAEAVVMLRLLEEHKQLTTGNPS